MMDNQSTQVLVGMLVLAIILSFGLSIAHPSLQDTVTETDTFKTGALTADTAKTVSLDPPNWFRGKQADGTAITFAQSKIKCTGLQGTATTTISEDGATFTVTDTAADTTDNTCTYRHLKEGGEWRALAAAPFFVALGLVVGLFALSASLSGSGDIMSRLFQAFLMLVVGSITIGIQILFTGDAQAVYQLTPGFTGVVQVLPLITLAVALAMLLGAISVGMGGKSVGSRLINRNRASGMGYGM